MATNGSTQRGFIVTQNTVRQILHVLDPEGIDIRRRNRIRRRQYYNKGPNYAWHLDGYDKLTPYGIGIHGCIDGFSRCIIWLEACRTNRDPSLVAGYFTKSVRKLGGCPLKIRADRGTENGLIEQFQIFLRNNNPKSFIYGRSCSNQRIEAWWGICRRENCQFWMNIFQTLKDEGHFSGDFIDKSLVQFCFMNKIQEELDETVEVWNSHRIRHAKNQTSPNGRHFIMFHLPEMYGTENYICLIDNNSVALCEEEITGKGPYPCDETIFELCCMIMDENNLSFPEDVYQLIDLYLFLRESIHSLL